MTQAAVDGVAERDRLRIGPVTITRIADIEQLAWPASAVFRDLEGERLQAAARAYPGAVDAAAGTLALSFSSYVIETPDYLCLIDCGIGNGKERPDRPLWHRRSGDFIERLTALGYPPERFSLVINTHLHTDHVGWNTRAAGRGVEPTFRNARYVVSAKELDHWTEAYRRDPHALHGAFADSVQPILDAGLFDPVELPAQVAPGLRLEPAPGHTGGMAIVRLSVSGTEIVFLADVLHSPIQLADPDLTSNFCVDPAQARATRHRLLDACLRANTIIATYHFPPPVFGRMLRTGSGYFFEPLERREGI